MHATKHVAVALTSSPTVLMAPLPTRPSSAACVNATRDGRLRSLKHCLRGDPLSAAEIAAQIGLKYCQVAWLLKTARGAEIHVAAWHKRSGSFVALYAWGSGPDAASPAGHVGPGPALHPAPRVTGRRFVKHSHALPARRCPMVAMLFGDAQC